MRNRPSIICQNISSKSVELEKYSKLHETIEKMLISVRVNFRPSWSNIVADKMPPSGHTKVFIEAGMEKKGEKKVSFKTSLVIHDTK